MANALFIRIDLLRAVSIQLMHVNVTTRYQRQPFTFLTVTNRLIITVEIGSRPGKVASEISAKHRVPFWHFLNGQTHYKRWILRPSAKKWGQNGDKIAMRF